MKITPKLKTIILVIVTVILLTVIIAFIKRAFGNTQINTPKDGYDDPQSGGGIAIASENVVSLVDDTKTSLDESYVFCYGANERCEIWRRWLDLFDGDFVVGANLYRDKYGKSLKEALKSVNCAGYCNTGKRLSDVQNRLKNLNLE